MRIEYHRTLIADRVRNRALFAALSRVIKNGETVVADIGAGTGLIGLMAARLGARDVYLYEMAEVAGVAAQIIKKNRARTCHVMPCSSLDMVDPPRVDVVISETLGNYAFEENMIQTLEDARARHLKRGGVIIPARVRQFVAPVIADRFDEELRAWGQVGPELGIALDLGFAEGMSLNNIYVRTLEPGDLLGHGDSARVWDKADFTADKPNSPNRKGEAVWAITSDVVIHGLGVWWEAELVPGVTLSTAPQAPRTHWEQLYFPLLSPLSCRCGETLKASLSSRSSEEEGTHLAWKVSRLDAKGKALERQSLDLDKGYLP
ncbi:MAG TPA: 50S ribosomal protein L11 methyltransferase [Hyphomicrobiaceae bacterium]|nr:50S ribosomal protein L11 methyltransferase [Hyphomicrobiaceae bacterium]